MSELKQTIEGFYKVSVLDTNNNIISEPFDLQKNLIVNNGMDGIYGTTYANMFTVADCGTGRRWNYVDSNGSKATANGAGTVTLVTPTPGGGLPAFDNAFFGGADQYPTASQSGDMIKFDTGEEARILSVTPTTLTVTPTNILIGLPGQEFTIWKTSQTSLQIHQKYAAASGISDSSIATGWPYTGTAVSGNIIYMRRAFDFPKHTGGDGLIKYIEIGVRSGSGAIPNVLFSRVRLPNSVSVDVGQRLRLYYELQVTFQPTQSVGRDDITVIGWSNTNASESIQYFNNGNVPYMGSSYVDTNGNASGYALLEPAASTDSVNGGLAAFISTSTASVQPFESAVNRTASGVSSTTLPGTTKLAYSNLSFVCDRFYNVTQANYSNIGSMGFGLYSTLHNYNPASANNQVYVMVFNRTQSKSSNQRLELDWRITWGRVLE